MLILFIQNKSFDQWKTSRPRQNNLSNSHCLNRHFLFPKSYAHKTAKLNMLASRMTATSDLSCVITQNANVVKSMLTALGFNFLQWSVVFKAAKYRLKNLKNWFTKISKKSSIISAILEINFWTTSREASNTMDSIMKEKHF